MKCQKKFYIILTLRNTTVQDIVGVMKKGEVIIPIQTFFELEEMNPSNYFLVINTEHEISYLDLRANVLKDVLRTEKFI